jgi:hypothetical protein
VRACVRARVRACMRALIFFGRLFFNLINSWLRI